MKEQKTAKFQDIIASEKPVLVDFYAEWCGPCKMMAPVLKDLKQKMGDEVSIIKVDVDKNLPLAQQYRIMGVPTFMIFKKGKMLWQQAGVLSLHQLEQELQKHS